VRRQIKCEKGVERCRRRVGTLLKNAEEISKMYGSDAEDRKCAKQIQKSCTRCAETMRRGAEKMQKICRKNVKKVQYRIKMQIDTQSRYVIR